jgi:C4-dicarboxylate-specific signal transduction histidine kinase
VCARKRAEQEVLEQQQQLARLGRLTILGEFAATIAHEIRQPLAAILANAESAALQLKREQLNVPFIVEVVDDIIADDLRARDVIQRLHSMLRNQATQRTPVQLNELASETLLLARGDLTRRGVISNVSLQPDLPSIMGDRVQIQQVVLNLILNACDAMIDLDDNRRRLTLKTRNIPQRNEVELIVCDLGRGIEESKLDRIFQPFVTTKADGLGLGLSISKSIITSHGGRLWVENAFPGAAFHVTLPNSARDSLATHSSSPVNGGRATPRNVSLASAPLARVRH